MVRVAIVDDDAQCRSLLMNHLNRYAEEFKQAFQIREFPDGDEIIEQYQPGFDIIFMDVVMHYLDGIKTAEKIRCFDKETLIIFISNMPQFAAKGYAVDALDYVFKPVSYPDFVLRMNRAMSRIASRKEKFLTISIKNGVQKLNIHDLYYVEVQDHDLMFHTADGTFEAKGTLSEIEEKLGSSAFFRCNKCYLVNLERVQGIRGCDVLVGGDTLQVSRAKKKELMDALNAFLAEWHR